MTKCDGCIFDNTCVDCNDFDCGELEALLKEHDKQIRADAIDECIEALGNNIWDIARLEQLKENNQ